MLRTIYKGPVMRRIISRMRTTNVRGMIAVMKRNTSAIGKYLKSHSRCMLRTRRLKAKRTILRTRTILRGRRNAALIVYKSAPLLATRALRSLLRCRRRGGTGTAVLATRTTSPGNCNHVVEGTSSGMRGVIRRGSTSPRRILIRRVGANACTFSGGFLFTTLRSMNGGGTRNRCCLPSIVRVLGGRNRVIATCRVDSVNRTLKIGSHITLTRTSICVGEHVGRGRVHGNIALVSPSGACVRSSIIVKESAIVRPGMFLGKGAVVKRSYFVKSNSRLDGAAVNSHMRIEDSGLRSSIVRSSDGVNPFDRLQPGDRVKGHIRVKGFIRIGGTVLGRSAGIKRLACIKSTSLNGGVGINYNAIFIGCSKGGGRHSDVNSGAFVNYGIGVITPIAIRTGAFLTTNSAVAGSIPRNTVNVTHDHRRGGPNC